MYFQRVLLLQLNVMESESKRQKVAGMEFKHDSAYK